MKYLLLAVALTLVGCADTTINLGKPSDLPEPPTLAQTIIGFNDGAKVSYACLQSEVSSALVWNTCRFHNFDTIPAQMCIKLTYNKCNMPVATSRKICSGPLQVGETKENYAAFTLKNGREELENQCGSNMNLCTMSAQEVK